MGRKNKYDESKPEKTSRSRVTHRGLRGGRDCLEKVASHKASAVGCNWNNSNASVRTVNGNYSVTNGNDNFVGSSAIPQKEQFSIRAENLTNKVKEDRTTVRQRSYGLLTFSNESPQEIFGGTSNEEVISRGNLKSLICDDGVIRQAIVNAAKNSKDKRSVKNFLKRIDFYAKFIKKSLENETYEVGSYRDVDIVSGGKPRTISILPLFDKCVQHVVKISIEPYLIKYITRDAYSCIYERGVTSKKKTYSLINQMQTAINTDRKGCKYYLEMDIKKFYPSLTNEVCLSTLFEIISCPFTRRLLYKIVMAYPSLAIGDPLSQLFMNTVMSDLDHLLREKLGVKHYFRYTDNLWILSNDKERLHYLRSWIGSYVEGRFCLSLKDNYQVKQTKDGLSACGYVIYPGYILIDRKIKLNYIKARNKPKSMASYNGILKHCNSINLRYKIEIMNNKMTNEGKLVREFVGNKVNFTGLIGQKIAIVDFEKRESTKKKGTCFYQLQIIRKEKDGNVIESTTTGADSICGYLENKTEADLPLIEVVRKDARGIYFEGTIVTDEEIKDDYIKKFNIEL